MQPLKAPQGTGAIIESMQSKTSEWGSEMEDRGTGFGKPLSNTGRTPDVSTASLSEYRKDSLVCKVGTERTTRGRES